MRIAHLSDLHFGRHDPRLLESLAADLAAQRPALVVISGDFAQIGSAAEFAAAGAFLRTLPAPYFAVPGNHDVPARNLLLRFTDPYRRYRRHVAPELEPFLVTGGVAIAGIKTSRRLRLGLNWAHGSISREQLAAVERRFRRAPAEAVKIVVAHHPLMGPTAAGMLRTVKRANMALDTFARLGVRLVLSGHFHLSYIRHHGGPDAVVDAVPKGPRRAAAAPVIVAQASTTLSTRLRGHPNAYNLIDIQDGEITIRVRSWEGRGWETGETVHADAAVPADALP